MLRSLIFVCFLLFVTACSNQLPVSSAPLSALPQEEVPYHMQYDRSALKNLKWMVGEWKGKAAGRTVTQSFLFHTDNMLEVTATEGGSQKAPQFFSWKDGHYYYGQNRQWIVSWISEKNIRFDPLIPGLKPMTWSRVHDNEWHLLRHNDQGDEVIVMERIEEPNS